MILRCKTFCSRTSKTPKFETVCAPIARQVTRSGACIRRGTLRRTAARCLPAHHGGRHITRDARGQSLPSWRRADRVHRGRPVRVRAGRSLRSDLRPDTGCRMCPPDGSARSRRSCATPSPLTAGSSWSTTGSAMPVAPNGSPTTPPGAESTVDCGTVVGSGSSRSAYTPRDLEARLANIGWNTTVRLLTPERYVLTAALSQVPDARMHPQLQISLIVQITSATRRLDAHGGHSRLSWKEDEIRFHRWTLAAALLAVVAVGCGSPYIAPPGNAPNGSATPCSPTSPRPPTSSTATR